MNNSLRSIVLTLIFSVSLFLYRGIAQNVGINYTGAAPNASAVLDISSTTSGLLVPRMTTAQMNAIAAPALSLVIYNTTVNCFEFWTGTAWVTMTCVCVSPSPNSPSGVSAPAINTCGNIYSVPVVPGATGYMWSITPSGSGTSITSGQGTATVNICFGPALQTYTICVYDSSLTCAKSPASCRTVTSTNCLHGSINFSYTGAMQTWTVPACITQVTVTLKGASGGNSATSGSPLCNLGGLGGTVTGVLPVAPGSVLNIFVGGMGATPVSPFGAQAAGGWNGGGLGGFNGSAYAGGGGGGMTDIRVGGVAWANIVVCAGAGGGAAYNYGCGGYDQGGPGGGATGGCGEQDVTFGCPPTYATGGGGSQIAGGAGGQWSGYCLSGSGGPGIGGNGCVPTEDGGGGGAGYYGGGAGCWEGGGGGSSYVTGLSSVSANTQGTNTGNGSLSLTY